MSITASSIPDLLKIGAIPVNTAQDVETSVLEPVVHSDGFCRFVFQNKGILHSHSKIEIGLVNSGHDAIFPLGVGAYSLIERVALKMGTKTICEIEDFAHWYAYKSLFTSNENMKERELYQTGKCLSHSAQYEDALDDVGKAQGGGESDTMAPTLGMDIGRDYDSEAMSATPKISSASNLVPLGFQNVQQVVAKDAPLFQLSLSELCPFLKMNQLPLYLIKEQVSLELTFSRVGTSVLEQSRRVVQLETDGQSDYVIDTTKTRLIADYIFFPQEMMSAYASANANMSFTYVDYQLSKYSIGQADVQSQMIRNIGGAGRIVSKIFWGVQDEFAEEEFLLNNYYAAAPKKDYSDPATANHGTSTINIKYNDNFLYPIDVSNSARHFHNVQQTEGLVPFINREEYSNEGDGITQRTLGLTKKWTQGGQGTANGTPAQRAGKATLSGNFFWCASRLNKNQRINSRGIELYFKVNELPPVIVRTDTDTAVATTSPGYTQRVYMEVVRTATLQDGYFQCYFA
tara:strand:- start:1560 stop:3107 length:1548 start_codon:yes stop_codon:yes gene_type:complete